MINKSELRLGNWVFGFDTPLMPSQSKKYFQVDGISEDGINCWRVEGFDTEYATFEPIPLTPEVLLAAGFQNFDNTWIVGRISEWEVHLMKYGFVITHETCDPRIWNIPINTLHGVQNAIFALTGTELEIDLTKAIK